MDYSFESCILNSTRLKRKNHVLSVLNANDIWTWTDFVTKPVPVKGLWKSEITILLEMREKEKRIRAYQQNSSFELKTILARYFSKHETTRVFGILQANKILSVRIFLSIRKGELAAISGIGKKSLDILMRIKQDLWHQAEELVKVSNNRTREYAAQPMLAGFN